jgi:2-polyprenyl-3-methyl-5-hydroxy-6-metoxy-1,4-benzoquinol methylase
LQEKFKDEPRVKVFQESVGANSIPDETLDFAVSLGVLHHIPDTALAIFDIAKKMKPGGEFLCY